MDKNNLTYAVVLMAALSPVSVAFGQIPADLSVPAPVAALGAPSISPNLSGEDGPGSLGARGSGSRSRAAVGGGPSIPVGVRASALSHSSFVTPHSSALSSRASLLSGHEKILQETWPTSVRASAKGGSRNVESTSRFIPGIGSSVLSSTTQSTMSSSRPSSSRSSVPEAPLYSLLVNHDKGGSRSPNSRQGWSSKFGPAKKSRSGFIQSLTGAGSGLGSSR